MFRPGLLNAMMACGLIALSGSVTGCKKETPSDGNGGKSALTKDDIADAVEMYVNEAAGNNGGYFVIFDQQTQKEVRLMPDRVNRSTGGKVSANMYFACAEFVTAEGDIYDVDIFVTGRRKGDLAFAEMLIHSVNGKERYTWYQEGNIWKRKPATRPADEAAEVEGTAGQAGNL